MHPDEQVGVRRAADARPERAPAAGPGGDAAGGDGGGSEDGIPNPLDWAAPVTEKPADGATEVWEVWNFSPEGAAAISHVFHMHMVQFQVLNREPIGGGTVSAPHPWERGRKDSCAAPTGLVTRVKATFDHKGRFVWHCHFLDHEDNDMMRPYQVV